LVRVPPPRARNNHPLGVKAQREQKQKQKSVIKKLEARKQTKNQDLVSAKHQLNPTLQK